MDRPERRRVRELLDRIIDAAPDRHASLVASGLEFFSPAEHLPPGRFRHTT
jgi:hypothetical protein